MKNQKSPVVARPVHLTPPSENDLQTLARLLHNHAPYDSVFDLPIPDVQVIRASRTHGELFHVVYRPSVCIVAQGSKTVFLGSEQYTYDANRMLVCSVELPLASQVTDASTEKPYLCLRVFFDPKRIARLTLKAFPHGLSSLPAERGINLAEPSRQLVGAGIRLLELLQEPGEAAIYSDLILDELLLRLLRGPLGSRIAQLSQVDSSAHRISKAVEHVRRHFDQPLSMEGMAALFNMGLSSFHQHFKEVTSMSPLQYQKQLRLQEARRLMLISGLDASTASRQVGYVSVSQFTREYGRLFGRTPLKDLAALRAEGHLPPDLN